MDRAEDAEVWNGTSSTTRSAENLSASVNMAEDAEVGEDDGDNNETVKRSPLSKKLSRPMWYLTSLRSNVDSASLAKRWVFLNNFGYSWDSRLKALPEWLWVKFAGLLAQGYKEQSSCQATQGSHSNQFLQKLTLHRYNKLSSRQVRGIYELSWYHSTLIIKLRLLGISTFLRSTSSLNLTLWHWLLTYRTHSYVSSTTGLKKS